MSGTKQDKLFQDRKNIVETFNFNSTPAGQQSLQSSSGIMMAKLFNNLQIETVDSQGRN